MIQRIQTVYLALGAVLLGAAPFVGQLTTQPAASATWFAPAVGVSVALAVVAVLISIFLYSNRSRQRLVVIVAQIMIVAAVGVAFAGRKLVEPVQVDSLGLASEGWMILALPAAAYILLWLARRAIDRDTALVQSMDRIR